MVAQLEPRLVSKHGVARPLAKPVLTHFLKGNAYYEAHQFDSALREYEAAFRELPDDPQIRNNRGVALSGLGRFQEALEALQIHEPSDYDAAILINRARVLTLLDRERDAVEALDEALKYPGISDAADLRKAIVERALRRLANAGFASWNGSKPKGSKHPVRLTPGPPISDYIVEERERLRGPSTT